MKLADIIETFLPCGFFPPVVPGTKFVTVGGMVAANVHGKNHHIAAGFGSHVERITLVLASGDEVTCSMDSNQDLFHAMIGDMGLTGVIRDVTFRLKPVESSFIRQEIVAARNIRILDPSIAQSLVREIVSRRSPRCDHPGEGRWRAPHGSSGPRRRGGTS